MTETTSAANSPVRRITVKPASSMTASGGIYKKHVRQFEGVQLRTVVKNPRVLAWCRVCLSTGESMKLLPILQTPFVLHKILHCATVDIMKMDPLSNFICTDCISDLNVAFKFRNICENSDAKIKKFRSKSHIRSAKNEEFLRNEFFKNNVSVIEKGMTAARKRSSAIRNADATKQTAKFTIRPLTGAEPYTVDMSHRELGISAEDMGAVENMEECIVPDIEMPPIKRSIEKTEDVFSSDLIYETVVTEVVNNPNYESETIYVCEECGKVFKSKHSLNGHKHFHKKNIEKKSHICSWCNKEFQSACSLTIHTRSHTGEKPFKCTFCERGFSDAGSRKKHERIHTGDKPYKCDICDRPFRVSHALAKHKLTHALVKPFKCEICGTEYYTKELYKRHTQKYHSDPNVIYIKPKSSKIRVKKEKSFENIIITTDNMPLLIEEPQ